MATKKTDGAVEFSPVQVNSDRKVQLLENRRRELALEYRKEKKIPVSISPMYRPYFGNVLRIAVNGISVFVPCNGKTYDVPSTFAAELNRKRARIDALLTRQQKVGDVNSNFERTVGELRL